ncbi:hypothetical protein NQ317_006655 [Molorchus minor]|uniref:Peptidase M13 C-terminal domain-containing protein n=1 Tax=Molorchus minor TaxID=1323400 RepID=A0ABQ9IVW1_9CUCU|nr:hypothetical protein NQ317_006655 [Molorchus minor]
MAETPMEYGTPIYVYVFQRNGTATLEENLSDVIGINLAYKAYQRWVTRNRPESMLPGVKFTTNQFFWIMASTYLCHDPNLDENDTCKNDDRHGISSFRVVGPIRNSPYFAKDWNCPVGSRMNPEDKCLILT